jgi:hypothetical protein
MPPQAGNDSSLAGPAAGLTVVLSPTQKKKKNHQGNFIMDLVPYTSEVAELGFEPMSVGPQSPCSKVLYLLTSRAVSEGD